MISVYIVPIFISIIIISSMKNHVPLYDTVTEGAEDGLKMVLKIMPTMVVILTAVSMLRASGVIEFLAKFLKPMLDAFHVPREVLSMIVLRPISGSGALGILTDNYKTYGVDSNIGILSSVLMGSTETTFYTIAVYFGATKLKNIKRAIPCAVIGDLVGIVTALIINSLYFITKY